MTTKHDNGKPRMDLIPLSALYAVADVLEFGAKKYGEDNWKTVPNLGKRYLAAALRHLTAWQDGEIADPESGKSHLAHAACSILFLLWFETHDKIDDKIASIDAEIAEVENMLARMKNNHFGCMEIDQLSLTSRLEILKEKRSKYTRTTNEQSEMENRSG